MCHSKALHSRNTGIPCERPRSPWEGIPIAILEAMACRVPVIATDVGAVGEIITHGENGFLVKRDEQMLENMERHLRQLLDSPTLRSEITHEALVRLEERFSMDRFRQAYREIIGIA